MLYKDKAPDLDDFIMAIWALSWKIVKEKITGFLKEFFEDGRLVKHLKVKASVQAPLFQLDQLVHHHT